MLFSKLPPAPPRKFVPRELDPADWPALERVFAELEARPVATVADFEKWLADQFELASVLRQATNMAYVRMTCDTTDEAAEKAFLHVTQVIDPAAKPHWNRLNEILLASPLAAQLPPRYALFLKMRRNEVDLYRAENVPLEAEDTRLDQQHDKIKGAQTVEFDGRTQTLIQLGTYQERTDRTIRQQAFEAAAKRRLEDRDQLNDIFDAQVANRHQRAVNAGFRNFRDFQHQRLARFDYRPEDCFAFHSAVEQCVMPVVRMLAERRRMNLGVDKLRPWDLKVDPQGRPPLAPFQDAERLSQGSLRIFQKVDPELGRQFGRMVEYDLLDLSNRAGKAPGGYQTCLNEYPLPFIFMNAVGQDYDVRVMLHEAGHAFHTFAVEGEPILEYREAPMEFCEVASMAMELIANQHLEEFYPPEDARRSRQTHLEGILELLPWIATIDAFQHWIYLHPKHTRQERTDHWLSLRRRFAGVADWTGYEEVEAHLWQPQGHLFGVPFYYIEYGIAQLGALGVWRNAQRDAPGALAAYRRALALGGSLPLGDLFGAAGLKFDFGPLAVKPLVEAVVEHLRLDGKPPAVSPTLLPS